MTSWKRRPPALLGREDAVPVQPCHGDEQQDEQQSLERQRLRGRVDPEHRDARRPLDDGRPDEPRLLQIGDPLPREHEGHVVEHRARDREERLERHLQAEPVDCHVEADQSEAADENAREHRRRAPPPPPPPPPTPPPPPPPAPTPTAP